MCDCDKYVPPPFVNFTEMFNGYTTIQSLNTMLNEYEASIAPCPYLFIYRESIIPYAVDQSIKTKIDQNGTSIATFLNDNACLIQDCIKNDSFDSLHAAIVPGMIITIRDSSGNIIFKSNL